MRRNIVYLLALALLLSACGEKKGGQSADYAEVISCLAQTWAEEDGETALQWKLARWYNVNLRSERPEQGFEEAYRSILYDTGGIMGYAEIPSATRILPIYHDGAGEGLVHDSGTDFPIGGSGNHSVLVCMEVVQLEQGDQIVIHILGERHVYQVGWEASDTCTLVCGRVSYTCGRVVED